MRFAAPALSLTLAAGLLAVTACAHSTSSTSTTAPSPDPRIGLRPGVMDAGEAIWNLKLLSKNPPPEQFVRETSSDISFTGTYAIQGNYNGYMVWDIANPSRPTLKTAYVCPATQSDVSVYKNLLFVSGEDLSARLDCGTQGVPEAVSKDRFRGLRIFDISDIANPKNIGNVQTCRGSHTHSVLADPRDPENVYVYISGSSMVRPSSELAGCASTMPEDDPNSALFRIEVIKVPLAHPEQAAIVSSPRIFNDLAAPAKHGEAPEDSLANAKAVEAARAAGGFILTFNGKEEVAPPYFTDRLLSQIVAARNGTGAPTAADSAALREALPAINAAMVASMAEETQDKRRGPTQCHDITLYPAIGLAGGACEGYGLLIDIGDPVRPVRIDAVADSNFSYWHSATLNNDGTKILFSDEWGGGGQAKCRATDKPEWGADAIFTISDRKMQFQSYYKLPVPQTPQENCVAHNGSLIPIPGRDVMAQAWYQGGVSVFDWTDAAHPREIAFFDRGPTDSARIGNGGYWSVYWYNGVLVGSEMVRGLDIFELVPSGFISRNEIDAAKSVHLEYLNVQGQPKLVWPPSFSLARAYVDQLERTKGLEAGRISSVRKELTSAEKASGATRKSALTRLAGELEAYSVGAGDPAKVRKLAEAVKELGAATN